MMRLSIALLLQTGAIDDACSAGAECTIDSGGRRDHVSIPAEWFVAAADDFGRLGASHPMFMSANQRSVAYGSSAGVFHTEFGIITAHDLGLLAAVFRLRFAYVALGAVASRENEVLRQLIHIHHKHALAGQSNQDKILDERANSELLHAMRGKLLPINTSGIPPIPLGGPAPFSTRSYGALPKKGMGFGGICNRVKLVDGNYDRCDEPFLRMFENKSLLSNAIKAGNRLFDSAWLYGSDKIIGRGMAASGYPRGDFFVMTKVIPDNFLPSAVQLYSGDSGNPDQSRWGQATISDDESAVDYFNQQLVELGTDYVDALCSHHIEGKRFAKLWKNMEKLQSQGKVRMLCTNGPHEFTLYKNCVERGDCRKQEEPVLLQIDWSPCAGDPHGLLFMDLETLTGSTLVVHDLARCRHEPIIEALAQFHNTSFFKVALSWAETLGAVGLFKSSNITNIELNLAPPLALSIEEIALLFGLQSLYVMSPFCENLYLAERLKYDPLGVRSLYKGIDEDGGSTCNMQCTHQGGHLDAEYRISEDGLAYTRSEFLDRFGDEDGVLMWDAARPFLCENPPEKIHTKDKAWHQLGPVEQKAAQALGLSQYEWDNYGMPGTTKADEFQHTTWDMFTVDQQENWRILGWNADMWNDYVNNG